MEEEKQNKILKEVVEFTNFDSKRQRKLIGLSKPQELSEEEWSLLENAFKKVVLKTIELTEEYSNLERNIGDIVSHNCDKNSPELWMKIIGKTLDKDKKIKYRCTYINKNYVHGRLGWKKKSFWNCGSWLRNIDKTKSKEVQQEAMQTEARYSSQA